MFPEDSKEYEVLMSRLKQCCVNQSKQIDKTKIGAAVKCMPDIWNTFQKIEDTDTPEQIKEKEFYNSILADKKPYFFRYKYAQTDKDYRHYIKKREEACVAKFGSDIHLSELFQIPEEDLTEEQKTFLSYYHELLPVVDTPCVMNKICHYIEDVDFNIKKKVRSSFGFDYTILQSEGFVPNRRIYEKVYEVVESNIKRWNDNKKALKDKTKPEEGFNKDAAYSTLKYELEQVSTNDEVIANHLITLFYEDKPSYNKNILWDVYGKTIFNILKSKTKAAYFPKKNPNGSLTFLDEKYSIEKVIIASPSDLTSDSQNTQEEKPTDQIQEVIELDEDIDDFDNIRDESVRDD